MYGLPIEKRAETAKVTLRKACNGTANTKKFSEALAGLPQTPKSFPRDLRDSRKHQKFLERLAGLPQTPKHFPRDLRDSRKRQKVSRETCGTPANTKKFLEALAGLPQTPKQKESVRRVLFSRARSLLCVYFMDGAGYLAIFSSHFNMPSMTNMEMRQMVRKTVQHCQMGILLYISGPIQRKRLPMAVAPSQRP